MADLIGRQFGNYRLTSLLGSGGFAEVYLGEHVRLGMQAAIKILHAHLADEDASAFQAEAHTIAELIHPRIIRVLDFDVENGTPFLVLDYAPSGSLSQRHKRGERVPLAQIVSYVDQVADALQYAHDRKHVHRDVKPANMLVGRQDEILLSDFGISSIAHSTSSMHTESPLGTLAYMAPEQIQGHARPASDQYALAVTVYQWLTGVLPFRGSSVEIIGQQLGGTPPPLRSVVPDISPAVETVVMTALAKDPRERYPGVRIFADELAKAGQGQSSTTFSYTATTVVSSEKNRRPPVITPPFSMDTARIQPDATPATWNQGAQAPNTTSSFGQTEAAALTEADALFRSQSTPYLQPVMTYSPPEKQPRTGWMVFWYGLILGVCLIGVLVLLRVLFFASLFSIMGIVTLLFFLAGLWTARKSGQVRSGIIANLWGVFLFVVTATLFFYWPLLYGAEMVIIAVILGYVGGLAGSAIYRSRQPIHPPAGGSLQ